jgi:protein-tyrosine phosphatase
MRRLLDAGVSRFIDLTEAGEWHPYADLAQQEATVRGQIIDYRHMPIPDRQTPPVAQMQQILACIDTALAAQRVVYVHCLAGIGRTGTVVGCHLVRSGMRGVAALHEIARLRRGLPDGKFESPETAAQRQFVCDWR